MSETGFDHGLKFFPMDPGRRDSAWEALDTRLRLALQRSRVRLNRLGLVMIKGRDDPSPFS